MEIISVKLLLSLMDKEKRLFESAFPKLISKLILSTVNEDIIFDFPHGSEIETKGYDGFVQKVSLKNRFIPLGKSIIEVGTKKQYKAKIKEDFEARNNDKKISDKFDINYIAVTPFNMNLKDKIELEKKYSKISKFKSFRIIDGNQIKDWLESNIDHSLWFLNIFGKEIEEHHIRTIESEWNRLVESTKPKLNSNFFLIGYDGEKNAFFEKLKSKDKSICYISCPSYGAKFSFYFAMAVIMNSNSDYYINNCIVVDDYLALNTVETYCKNKIVLVNFNYAKEKQIFLVNNRYIFFDEYVIDNIKLNIKKKSDIKLSFENLGVKDKLAEDICISNGYNPISIIRSISLNPKDKIPLWYHQKEKYNLVPLAVLGSINFEEKFESDIFNFVVKDKDNFINELNWWTEHPDPPVRKNGPKFNINSKNEYFNFVHVDYFLETIKLFENNLLNIINEQANYSDREISRTINSIIDSFIIMSTKNSYNDNHFTRFAYQVFDLIFEDKNKFSFFSSCLRHFVELSPVAFLNSLNSDNKKRDEILSNFLNTDKKNYLNSYVGSNFLYALETVLSIKEFSVEALKALLNIYYFISDSKIVLESISKVLTPFSSAVGLVALKPTDKLNIFFNYADGKDFKKTVKLINRIRNHGEAFFFSCDEHITKYARESLIVTYEDIWASGELLASWMISNSNVVDIIDDFINSSHKTPINRLKNQINSIKKYLKATDLSSKEKDFIKVKILKQRESILKFNSWKNLLPFVPVYDELLSLLSTDDYFENNRYILYDDHFPLLNPISENGPIENEIQARKELQEKIVGNLIDIYGREKAIYKIVKNCPHDVYCLWNNIKKYIDDKNYQKIIKILIEKNFSCGLRNCLSVLNIRQIATLLKKFKTEDIFIRNLPYCLDVFHLIDGLKNESVFWENNFYDNNDKGIMKFSYNKYLNFYPFKLVDFYAYQKELDLEMCIAILNSISKFKKLNSSHDSYSLRTMIDNLDNNYYNIKLSLAEINVLNYVLDDFSDYPLGVKKYFWYHPKKLGDLLISLSKSRELLNRNTVAHKMLYDAIYSMGDSCYIPKDYILKQRSQLFNWCKKLLSVGEKADEKSRYILNSAVVNILSCCPIDSSLDKWPIVEVADILEYLSKQKDAKKFSIASKFYCCYANKQGVRTIGDGKSELSKSQKFQEYSDKYSTTHLETAKALSFIANGFKNESEFDKKIMFDEKY